MDTPVERAAGPDAAPEDTSGHLYHRHDGALLAFVPGGRDEDFEHHLRERGIPFKVIQKFPRRPMLGELSGQHLGVYRKHPVQQPDGSLALHHVIHHANGTRMTFAKETLSALGGTLPSNVEGMVEVDLTQPQGNGTGTALATVDAGGIDYDKLADAMLDAQDRRRRAGWASGGGDKP